MSERGVFAAGSDTVAFEKVPDLAMPVHVHLLVESGIHIIECLNLDELAGSGVKEFVFVALPLNRRENGFAGCRGRKFDLSRRISKRGDGVSNRFAH